MFIWLQKYKSIVVAGLCFIIVGFLFLYKQNGDKAEIETNPPIWLEEVQGTTPENEQVSEKLYVDVKGAVKQPGLYEVSEEDRVFDVIERSGGLLESADESQVNFALKVYDEMVIYIPKIGEVHEATVSSGGSTSKDEKININKASSAELETLPGIGPGKAAAIIEYREKNGKFHEIEDIMNISGIGEKTFEKLKDSITVK